MPSLKTLMSCRQPCISAFCPNSAEDAETALREKFQMKAGDESDGLTRDELALTGTTSYAAVAVSGELHRVFDLTTPANLKAVATVLARIRMPSSARAIQRRLNIKSTDLRMLTTSQQLYDLVLAKNRAHAPGSIRPSRAEPHAIRADPRFGF